MLIGTHPNLHEENVVHTDTIRRGRARYHRVEPRPDAGRHALAPARKICRQTVGISEGEEIDAFGGARGHARGLKAGSGPARAGPGRGHHGAGRGYDGGAALSEHGGTRNDVDVDWFPGTREIRRRYA